MLDEILEIHKLVAEGFTPFQLLQRILQEVAGFYVAIHADVIQNVLQIDFLLRGEVVTLYELLVDLKRLLAVYAVDYTDKRSHIVLVRMALGKLVVLILVPNSLKKMRSNSSMSAEDSCSKC